MSALPMILRFCFLCIMTQLKRHYWLPVTNISNAHMIRTSSHCSASLGKFTLECWRGGCETVLLQHVGVCRSSLHVFCASREGLRLGPLLFLWRTLWEYGVPGPFLWAWSLMGVLFALTVLSQAFSRWVLDHVLSSMDRISKHSQCQECVWLGNLRITYRYYAVVLLTWPSAGSGEVRSWVYFSIHPSCQVCFMKMEWEMEVAWGNAGAVSDLCGK